MSAPAAPAVAPGPDLAALLRPASVAIVGASERNYYAANAWRRLHAAGFGGPVRLVNPNRSEAFGAPCVPRLAALPEVPELALVAVSRGQVVPVLAECAEIGVRAAVVVANGFRESALPDGAELQDRLARTAREGGVAVCGPSCLGVANLPANVDLLAGGGAGMPAGNVAFVTQSGGGALAFEAGLATRHLGASIVVSSGNEACLDCLDYLEFCLRDDRTAVVCAFIEGIRRPERVAEVGALARALGKPLVVAKVGRSRAAERAALSHTGAVTGSDLFHRTLLSQHGFRCVDTIEEMLDTVTYLATAGRAPVRRLSGVGIVSASGGATTILSDLAERHGMRVPALKEANVRRLSRLLPEHLHPANPLDISGTVQRRLPEVWTGSLDCVAGDPGVDALVVVSGTIRDDEQDLLGALGALPARHGKPVVLASVSPALEILSSSAVGRLQAAGLGYVKGMEAAVRALAGARRVGGPSPPDRTAAGPDHRAALPAAAPGGPPGGAAGAGAPGGEVRDEDVRGGDVRDEDVRDEDVPGGYVLDELAAGELLAGFGIRRPDQLACRTADEVATAVGRLGPPVALKAAAADIPHKTDAGLVALDVTDPATAAGIAQRMLATASRCHPPAREVRILVQRMVRGVGELMIGVTTAGIPLPMMVLGPGGTYAELFPDRVSRVLPVSRAEARWMLAELPYTTVLRGYRGRPAGDLEAVADAMAALSECLQAHRDTLREIEINPLVVGPEGEGAVAVDALAVCAAGGDRPRRHATNARTAAAT